MSLNKNQAQKDADTALNLGETIIFFRCPIEQLAKETALQVALQLAIEAGDHKRVHLLRPT